MLEQALAALKTNLVPLLYVYCDGAKDMAVRADVEKARSLVKKIDWTEVKLHESVTNLGLGRSILTGVTEVLNRHEAALVFEDDIVCVPGSYEYLCSALRYYREAKKVMSIAGWTHSGIRPPIPDGESFFDGRFTCWGWGTWRRAWVGMHEPAVKILRKCRWAFKDVYRYGSDLPESAFWEQAWNVWAVRFAMLHILRDGLCFHPPHSLTQHIGYDARSTNCKAQTVLEEEPLMPCPPIPSVWPSPSEHPVSPHLWQDARGLRPSFTTRASLSLSHAVVRARYGFHRLTARMDPSRR
jgi:hypothetical protein